MAQGFDLRPCRLRFKIERVEIRLQRALRRREIHLGLLSLQLSLANFAAQSAPAPHRDVDGPLRGTPEIVLAIGSVDSELVRVDPEEIIVHEGWVVRALRGRDAVI